LVLLGASSSHAEYDVYLVGEPKRSISMEEALDALLSITAIRNPDFYEYKAGDLVSASG